MQVNAIELYDLLKVKIGETEAKSLVTFIETASETRVEKKFEEKEKIFKDDIRSLKEYMDKVFATKEDLSNVKADMIKWMFIFWIGQLAAILAIIKVFFS